MHKIVGTLQLKKENDNEEIDGKTQSPTSKAFAIYLPVQTIIYSCF